MKKIEPVQVYLFCAPYRNRTDIPSLRGLFPIPLEERSIFCSATDNRNPIDELKARFPTLRR